MPADEPDESTERRRSADHAIEALRRETNYRFEAISQRLSAQEATVAAAVGAAKEAVVLAALANEKRFDTLALKMDNMSAYMERLAGKSAGVSTTMGYMVAAATLVISVVVFLVGARGR